MSKLKANWNIAKGKVKQRFGRLMDDEMQFFEGKVDELIGRIQKRAGLAQKAVQTVRFDPEGNGETVAIQRPDNL